MGFRQLWPTSVMGIIEILLSGIITLLLIGYICQKGCVNWKMILLGIVLFLIINVIIVKVFGLDSTFKNQKENNSTRGVAPPKTESPCHYV